MPIIPTTPVESKLRHPRLNHNSLLFLKFLSVPQSFRPVMRRLLTTDGGFLRDVALDNYTEAYEMTPLYSWLIGMVTGFEEGEWNPYGDQPGPQK